MKKSLYLTLSDMEQVASVAKALSSEIRISILKLLDNEAMNISELAQALQIPVSTAALQIKVLEEAGLVTTQPQPGIRGSQKVSGIRVDRFCVDIKHSEDAANQLKSYVTSMPIGNFYDINIIPPCGIANERCCLSPDDELTGFFLAERTTAQLLWFYKGHLEYRFSNHQLRTAIKILSVDYSFECCSEALGYNNNWPSDITLWINDKEICTFTSLGDYGGRRGKMNPDWWPDDFTQFGFLHNLSITPNGCIMDGKPVSTETIDSLKLDQDNYISFKIGVKEKAKNAGGINLFGDKFGDYEQGIVMRVNYRDI
jgi:predicted transcriptional regulator